MPTLERETQNTRIGQAILNRMEERGVSIRDLAGRLEVTYEHARRITKGESVPSKYVLKLLCEYLDMDFAAAEKLRNMDRIQAKFGDLPLELSGKIADLDPLERVWNQLTPEQKNDLTTMGLAWAKRNKALGLT
jgi:transcriptional regulator with XRE-family HTH domain